MVDKNKTIEQIREENRPVPMTEEETLQYMSKEELEEFKKLHFLFERKKENRMRKFKNILRKIDKLLKELEQI